jgi:hypothetical protein
LLNKLKTWINKEFESDKRENKCKVLEIMTRKTLHFVGFYLTAYQAVLASKDKKLLDILELLTR